MEGGGVTDKGRWFRVYARQVDEHAKFADLSALELGAWLALRSEAELRDRAMLRSREDAVLVLKRRKVPRPAVMVDRLVGLRLFDVDDVGRVTVHDRADHDRPYYPSDAPDQAAQRQRESRAAKNGHEPVTSRDGPSHDTHARDQASKPPQPTDTASLPSMSGEGLPAETDSATAACRKFVNGGTWLGNDEYVAAWDDMDRRYGAERVRGEIDLAFARLHAENAKVKPWALKHAVEFACAEWVRGQEIERERAQSAAARAERERIKAKADAATDEEKRRAAIARRAIGLWIKARPNDPVPEDFDELEAWLTENEPKTGAAA